MQQDRYGQVKSLRPAVFRDHVGNLPRSAARWSGEAHATPSVGRIFAPCMIPGTSTQKRGLPGKIRALCIRNRPIAPRNGYMGRRSCQLQREKHAFRANAAREAPFFVQSAKREYMARESCHSSQSNLEDRHNESIGRRNANPKKDPGTTAKSPNTKATPTRPLFWQPEATLKSTCHQDNSRKGANPRSMKQLARQLSTKDPWRKAACASSFDAHRCRHRRS